MNYKPPKLFDSDNSLDGRWYVHYAYKSPDTGKFERFRTYISSEILTKTGRRDEAHKIIKTLNLKLAEGWNPYQYREKKHTNIVASLEEMLAVKMATLRKRTAFTYRNHIKTFTDWLVSAKYTRLRISEFNRYHAQQYADYLKLTANYKNRTFNNHLMSMKAVFEMLYKRDYLVLNPFSQVNYLPVEEAELIAFSDSDLRFIASTLPLYNPRLWLVAQLIYYCFLRPQEIVRLKYGDVDLARRQIFLSGWQTKNKKNEVVDIPDPLIEEFQKIQWMPANMYIFGKGLEPGYKEQAQTRIDEVWSRYRKHVEMDKSKTIYAMKHTGVGKLMDTGIDARSIQLQIRHASLDETQKYLDRFRRRPNQTLRSNFPKLG